MTYITNLDPVWRMALVIVALLVVSTAIVEILKRAKPEKNFSELAARVYAWWVMAAIFFGAIAVNNRISLVFFAFLAFWAFKEFITLLHTRTADHKALVLAFLAIPAQFIFIDMKWYGMFIIFIPVYMFLFVPIRLVLSRETSGFVASASQIQWGLMAFVFGLSHAAFLLTFGAMKENTASNGRTMLLFLVFIVEMSDVLQYVWGKTLGKHKILPTVSPNKTWEGFLGGIASVMAVSLLLRFLTPFTMRETLLVSFLVAVAGFFGGAVMSAVKRDFGVKDFGALIPGHGGMLDRVDSLCYAAPVFFHFVRYFHT